MALMEVCEIQDNVEEHFHTLVTNLFLIGQRPLIL